MFSTYSKLLAQYMKSVGTDLTSDLCPPKSLFIEVRVKQDYGELETPDGDVSLKFKLFLCKIKVPSVADARHGL